MVSLTRAIELVGKLSRTRNYPKDDEAMNFLARGLQDACDKTGIGAGRIIDKCAAESEFCPTDHDLLMVAKEIARLDAVADGTYNSLSGASNVASPTAEWKKKYGDPKKFDMGSLDMDRLRRVKERERKMLAEIKAKYPQELSWPQMAKAARELGYEDYAKAWEEASA